ncbi:MAG: hypothetical protein ABEL97_11535 [Salinibacter sp.]
MRATDPLRPWTPLRSWWGRIVLSVLLLAAGGVGPAAAQRFLSDDPLWTDPDRMDMPFPEPRPADQRRVGPVEFVQRMFRGNGGTPPPAANVNTVQGVPNSSWYTNRHYRDPMSEADLRRGPDAIPGPTAKGPWRVQEVREGSLPRAVVRDSTGRRFHLLLDAADHPELATGAAMVGSRLLYALGYNVPHYWLRTIRPARLVPGPEARLTPASIDRLLARAPRRADSTYRVVLSRIPDVERRIGPFRFYGRRTDDANDVFPHQNRRELRALRVVSAWIHHSMIRPRHTLDVGVRERDRRFVRHYLTDLYLTLGSAGTEPKPPWSGHERLLELDQVLERVATIGLSGGDWAETVVPEWPGVGHFEADGFRPRQWRPAWPNPAFLRCTAADAFWAAKKIRHFSRGDLAAIVSAADYSSPATMNYMVQTLMLRRNAIARAYLQWGGGLARFAVEGRRLTFRDLPARYGHEPDSLRRTVTWHVFKNQENRVGRQLARTRTSQEAIPIPPSRASFLRVRLQSGEGRETRVFLRRRPSPVVSLPPRGMFYEVVGIERRGRPVDR